ncbi:MAG: ubiquitin [Firmicutes bacterium]|nr:ubiquitin [Bacillota bacterium]
MTTLEQIEKLREKANVTYEEAKSALDAANGDLLDALILLEKQGKVEPPAGGGFYSSAKGATEVVTEKANDKQERRSSAGESFGDVLDRIGKFCISVINKGNAINLEVRKNSETKARCPLTVLVLLLIFAPWITLPLIIVGLVLGYQYRFTELGNADEA